ncbi:MAG: hypothetical protein J0H62_09615 [Rhizobiales bacterium]|nr:hypothetical protein [Hyphomicrobiales bacterium]
MIRTLTPALAALTATIAAAHAHPGDHSHLDAQHLVSHLMEPDHLGAIVVIVFAIVGIFFWRRRTSRKS